MAIVCVLGLSSAIKSWPANNFLYEKDVFISGIIGKPTVVGKNLYPKIKVNATL